MNPFFKSIRFKISFFIIILLLVTASLFTLVTIQTMNRHILNEVIKRAEALSKTVAASASHSILTGDLLGMDNVGWKVKEANPDVEYVGIANAKMKMLAHTDVKKIGEQFQQSPSGVLIRGTNEGTRAYELQDGSDSFEVITPFYYHNRQIGSIIMGINKSVLQHARLESLRRIITGLCITLLLGIVCILILSSFLTRPIRELSKGVAELKLGRIPKLKIYADDELGNLTESFNQMAQLTSRQQAKLKSFAQELENSYISTVKVLAAAIDARDPYTLGHSTRVARLAVRIGEAMGFSPDELEDLEIASLFHDVGKLKTPDYLLLKSGPLNAEEHREVANHCENGAAILSRAPSLQKYIPAVRHHHEWYDGTGYPDRLRGDEIPVHAAIISIADAFDAMTSIRPYKQSRSLEDALTEVRRYSGKQFNPRLVTLFMNVIAGDPVLAEQFSGRQ